MIHIRPHSSGSLQPFFGLSPGDILWRSPLHRRNPFIKLWLYFIECDSLLTSPSFSLALCLQPFRSTANTPSLVTFSLSHFMPRCILYRDRYLHRSHSRTHFRQVNVRALAEVKIGVKITIQFHHSINHFLIPLTTPIFPSRIPIKIHPVHIFCSELNFGLENQAIL